MYISHVRLADESANICHNNNLTIKWKTINTTLSEHFQNLVEKSWEDGKHDHSLSWLGTGTSIKGGRVKLVY